jgi:hypothetical protein
LAKPGERTMYYYESILIYVPKKIIKELQEPLEQFGGHIAILVNGMWTDVHLFNDGNYYTQTNNGALIDYLRKYPDKKV